MTKNLEKNEDKIGGKEIEMKTKLEVFIKI